MDLSSTSIALPQVLLWPTDWVLIAAIAFVLAFVAYQYGPARVSAAAVAFPITYVLLPWMSSAVIASTILQSLTDPIAYAGIFSILFIGVYVLVNRMFFTYGSESGGLVQSILCGVASSVVIVLFWIITPGIRDLWSFGPQVQLVFGETYRAWWLLLAYGALAFARG